MIFSSEGKEYVSLNRIKSQKSNSRKRSPVFLNFRTTTFILFLFLIY